jgi:uncharacterized membrane protein
LVRRWLGRTFLDGEGEIRRGTFGLLAVAVFAVGVVLAYVWGTVPVPLWLALFTSLGYVAGERSGSGGSGEVESVGPPFISAE